MRTTLLQTIREFLMEKISFYLKLVSGHFYGQSFMKTVRGPYRVDLLTRKYELVRSLFEVYEKNLWKVCLAGSSSKGCLGN